MLLSRETIESLEEAEFRRKVLIPLFVAMGFRDVLEYHGAEELGKDIVMWKPDVVSGRENYAVVAKVGKIDSRNRGEVQGQISQCFGESFPDPVTGAEKTVDRVIVATSGKVTPHAQTAIRADLRTRNLNNQVDFLAGDLLIQRVREYLSQELIWESLKQAQKVLAESFADWGFGLTVYPDGTTGVFITNKPGAEALDRPIKVSVMSKLPPTIEGAEKRAEMQRFFEEGEAVELTSEFIEDHELPEFAQTLLAAGKVERVYMSASLIDPPILRRLDFLGAKGSAVTMEYVHFTHVQSSRAAATISNKSQPIPFRIKLRFDKTNREKGSLGVSWDLGESPDAVSSAKALLLSQVFAEGGKVVIRDWKTQVPEGVIDFEADTSYRPNPGVLEVARRLALIQERAGVVLEVGKVTISSEEIVEILRTSDIIAQGRYIAREGAQFTAVVDARGDEAGASSEVNPDVRIKVQVSRQGEVVTILGKTIDLGPSIVHYDGPVSAVEEIDGGWKIQVQASNEYPILLVYPKWFSPWSQPSRAQVNEDSQPPHTPE